MDDDVRHELRHLRARAYGPDADIDDDPAAVARLTALEELERGERTPRPPQPATPAHASQGQVVASRVETAASGTEDDEVGPDDDEDAAEAVRERRPLVRSRRNVWAWAISLAVVTALASAATALSVTFVPVPSSVGAPQVGTLELDPDGETPAIFGQQTGDERAFRDYFGVTAFSGFVRVDAAENRSPCIYLLATEEISAQESRGISGNFVYGGCGAGIFPATVEFVVADGMPEAFVERFPVGTSVQFVFDGENVGVFADGG
ncbi:MULTISPECIES: hypothetical protein [Microbacterium]|uniref:hypothetical protein n=1 Tax=Microbacterium TaxID=33882 RepID=UPI0027810A9D|nr:MULTISPECIES: hypothetical protein [Microbacterium]MDQ1084855.1 hypothetical protein [Microbacterium sp. SORGH_AS_0344]MDQ1169865.1 hypothetical protein [Microbacterium proteolyticum]